MFVDLVFRLTGDSVPSDHGYTLYSSLSALLPTLHQATWLGIHPINGLPAYPRVLKLTERSCLRLRLPVERLSELLPLAGKRLTLTNNGKSSTIRVGLPEVHALKPSAELFSSCVFIKLSSAEKAELNPSRQMFLTAVEAQLQKLEVAGKVWIDDRRDEQGHEVSRRVLHVKNRTVVGYAVRVSDLSDEHSIMLQEVGLGGRRRMGGGLFNPVAPLKEAVKLVTERLLAKSYSWRKHPNGPPDYALLVQHSRDVAAACNALSDTIGRAALQNAALPDELFAPFKLALRANGWGQDLGKASSHFQEMVSRPYEFRPQLLRHETISGLLLHWEGSPLASWFASLDLPRALQLAALWGAMGHHRQFDKDTKPGQCERLTVKITNPDFRKILDEMAASLNLGELNVERDLVFVRADDEVVEQGMEFGAFQCVRRLQKEFKKLCRAESGEFADENTRQLLALVKGFGIAADVAASAVAKREYEKRGQSRAEFVADFIKTKLKDGLTPNDLAELIKQRTARPPERRRAAGEPDEVKPFRFRRFQKKMAGAADRGAYLTLASAGCGSGKSLAAYLWARRWCKRLEREGRTNFRLFFCLPTTGTTTEHYKDYALESGITNARLIHSRAEIDLEEIAQTVPQESAPGEQSDRIESLELWDTPLVVCTTDTVLGLMANARRAVYSLPALMCGAVVFDEVHAFDEQLFGHLLVFLKNFPRLPVLLMTASLPDERLRAIKAVRADFEEDRDCIRGPKEFEELPRYLIRYGRSEQEVREEVEKCLRAGGKVLWVCNRVDRANDKYAEWRTHCREQAINAEVNVYHARFRYTDRSKRHTRVIKSFKKEDGAALLVATQVAEMSLDLSADLLVTDIAPVPALIQRMGRLNRRALPTDPEAERPPKLALVCPLPAEEEAAPLPYREDEMKVARLWLSKFESKANGVSQRDLSEQFADLSKTEAIDLEQQLEKAEENACFFSGLWETRPGQTRTDGHTVSVVLQQHLKEWQERNHKSEPPRTWIRENEVAIPFKPAVLGWKRVRGVRCAPPEAVTYNEEIGAAWR